jgi:methionine-gamma-lyase
MQMIADIAQKYGAISVVDNTYLGPCFQQPARHGISLAVYSATKYLAGHSDVLAGAVSGGAAHIAQIGLMRSSLGNIANPFTSWLLCRSTETLHLRTARAAQSAAAVAAFLSQHQLVAKVYYLGNIQPTHPQYHIYKKQCTSAGAMLAFDAKNADAVPQILDKLRLIKQAVSLGGTESLATNPYYTTHAGWTPEAKAAIDITPAMVRISVGVEHPDDLIADLKQALEAN